MRIAIVGLGQIGGSMALRLKASGYDPDLFDLNSELCKPLGGRCEIFDGHGYDLVVLALHTGTLLKMIEFLPKDNLYLDTASVKMPIVEAALQNKLNFVGGHPIAGNERTGIASWDPDLFEGRPFATVQTGFEESPVIDEFIELLGAIRVKVDADFHDIALAHTSQALHFVSRIVKELGEPYETLSGPGYASMTRLSKQNPLLEETFREYNALNISKVLDEMVERLKKISEELKK
jgi:prephenate dehydrogenase